MVAPVVRARLSPNGFISEHGRSDSRKKSRIALYSLKRKLAALFIVAAMLVCLAAGGIHYFEKDVQPEAFSSLFDTLQWTIVTFTTIGYGDVYPITTGGKVFTALVSFVGSMLGIGVVAIVLHHYFCRVRDYFRRTLEDR